jgi:hypothetical protein
MNGTSYLQIGWIKKGGATADRSRTLARGPLFGPPLGKKKKEKQDGKR